MGLMAPYFFTALYFFMTDSTEDFSRMFTLIQVKQKPDWSEINMEGFTTTLIVMLFCLAAALLKLRAHFYKNVIKTRSFQWIILILLLFTMAVPLFSPEKDFYEFSMTAMPLSVIIGYFFLATKREWLNESLFAVLLVLLVFNLLRS
jgi:hypothetical protein